MNSTITVRCTAEEKQAIIGFARINNTSISTIVLQSVLAQIEDAEDYELALMVANEPTIDIRDLAAECGIDYEKL